MFKIVKKLTVILVSFSLIIPQGYVLVAEDDFNPNFLLSDEEMQAWQSMSRADIQAFLEDHNSYLARLRTNDLYGAKRLASDIIYRASREHKINPKYTLVKLQKEQSLITETNPSQKRLDWATGYGICDNCSKSDPTLQKHKGFGIQVDSAAGIMRWYYDNLRNESWIKRTGRTYKIDSTDVRPVSLATGFLYTYTPHILGNKNFWTLWQRWFEQVYPDGTLVKTKNDSTVYLIQKGKKRAFANMTALLSRFDQKYILTAPASELSRYEAGPSIKLPNYAIVKSAGNYYLLDNEYARQFANFNVVKKLGYHPDEIIDVPSTDIAAYKIGKVIGENAESALGKIVKVNENKKYYFLEEKSYFPISDEQILDTNFAHLSVENVSATELHDKEQGSPVLFKDGIIFGITGANKIYVTENGKKRHIASEDVFNGLGYNWSNIIWTDQFTGLNHTTGQPIYLRQDIAKDVPTIIASEDSAEANETIEVSLEDKMYRTLESEWKYVGPKFETDINTYLIWDRETDEIVAGKNIDDVRPMASFAKVMTAYRLQKEGLNISRSTTYDPVKHKALYHRFRIAKGEKVLNKNLLDAALVSSLNTATQMLVSSVNKNLENFVANMNKQAKDLGLENTSFIDVTGERLENITTAREFLTIYQKATANSSVQTSLGKTSYRYDELLDTDGKPSHFDNHSNKLTQKASSLPFRIITSKTGYLHESGAGLVMEIQRKTDNKRFVIISMGNADYANRFDEPERLSTWVINNF
jgi:serine-type D-Ala-D-Ala endopeptidase (penicillin-binding protein 7)